MSYCCLWMSGYKTGDNKRLFFNTEEDMREILNWWKKNDIYPQLFRVSEGRVYIGFSGLIDEEEIVEMVFVAIMERMEERAIIRFEYRGEGVGNIAAIFIGLKYGDYSQFGVKSQRYLTTIGYISS